MPYSLDAKDVLKKLSSNPVNGLSTSQVKSFTAKFGPNELRKPSKKSLAQKIFDQLKDTMIIILLIAAAISLATAIHEGNSKELLEPILILLIVVVNAIMGISQESKAEKALDELRSMSAPNATVIRDEKRQRVASSSLVPGDIITLEAGDLVPADARLISSSLLKIDEAALTGESIPAEKNSDIKVDQKAPLGDRFNMVYAGCPVTYGSAKAVITATGMNTEIGKISELLRESEDQKTPLQQRLSSMGKYLGITALAACAVIFIIGLIDKIPIMEIFMTSVSLAVSAIPEGLPAIVTVVLAIGVQRMVKRNVIIRRLPAVESLGSASVICSDKTGTLTQNRMTLLKAYADNSSSEEEIGSQNSEQVRKILEYATLCSNGSVIVEENKEKHIGDPTETAITLAAYKNGIRKDEIDKKYKRLLELPFDSDRKLMTTINEIDNKKVVIVKGAFDMLSRKCSSGNIKKAEEINNNMSRQALRVIAVAVKYLKNMPDINDKEEIEDNLSFIGLVGMIDPPRPEARKAVEVCRKAGIKPVMITGDHIETASAIASELGILEKGGKAISGKELGKMSDDTLFNQVKNISVYARVSPEDKIRIVKAWKKNDKVVAMTGDGVNDAPALKAADIGCAMGITGTDVAKGAADMILSDDNFSTIVHAVKEGRGIYENIIKVIGFLLGTNIGEVLSVLFAMLLWRQVPLISVQLLWINLVTDGLPAIALGMENIDQDIMKRKPRPRNEGIFSNGLGIKIILQGFMFAILTLIGYKIGISVLGAPEGGRTMAFIILALSQIVQSFNMRYEKPLLKTGIFGNKNLNIAALISLILVLLVVFTPIYAAFGMTVLPLALYIQALALSLVPLIIMEISKSILLIMRRKKV